MNAVACFVSRRTFQTLFLLLCCAVAVLVSASHRVDTNLQSRLLNPNGRITVRASRGNQWINLRDGNAVAVSYDGESKVKMLMDQGEANPTQMTSADFDEDGVPDLVCAYSSIDGDVLTFHRGNIDSLFPYSPEAKQRKAAGKFIDSPFLPDSIGIPLTERADQLGAGDFDADGHWDIVTAAKGSNVLHFIRGDGQGDFTTLKQIALDGLVTSLVTGEMNRADGLIDLVVAVRNQEGSKVLVFEGPEGALSSQPENFPLPTEANALAVGQLDDEGAMDLVVAAGSELLIIHGRDRKLSLDVSERKKVPQAVTSVYSFESTVTSMALGSFTGEGQKEIAALLSNGRVQVVSEREGKRKSDILLPANWDGASRLVRAKVSSLPHDDLVLAGRAKHQIHILGGDKEKMSFERVTTSLNIAGEPTAVLPMRLNTDALDDFVILIKGQNGPSVVMTLTASTFVVNSTGDADDCDLNDGVCSNGTVNPETGKCVLNNECTLRAAIHQANFSLDADTIAFSIGSGPRTITPLSALPTISSPVSLDGTTQPGFAGSPIIEVNGASLAGSGLTITAGSSTVKGLVINRVNGRGIALQSNGNNMIAGNYIGTGVSGTSDFGNSADGVFVGSPNNTIGGTTSGARNIISGNGTNGVFLLGSAATGNLVRGNYIGIADVGNASLGNLNGVVVSNGASNNLIGGTAAGSRNIISGNTQEGLAIISDSATHNLVQGNYIGTNATGTADLGNMRIGVRIAGSPDNTIGGTSVAARNVISGNDSMGIAISNSAATGNFIQGNYVGTDVTGVADLGNSLTGVLISGGASKNTIGGASSSVRNIISANDSHGVAINENTTSQNSVQGNYIGTDATGTADLGNIEMGVFIANSAANNTIGGTSAGTRNVISGNNRDGIHINNNATENIVRGNYVGTDTTGTAALGNTRNGITIDVAPNNTIGGTPAGAGNIISGNKVSGIQINGITATGNQVQGNYLGTQADGQGVLPNSGPGVFISTFAGNNSIGGRIDGAGNRIRNNGNDGVLVVSGTGNAIVGNSIFGNVGEGIDLGQDGITLNDADDVDSGPNNLQNFPELTTISSSVVKATIKGTLNGKPGTTFTLDFYSNNQCDSDGFGEGERHFISQVVTTKADGNANFNITLTALQPGTQITATATDSAGNTSEFSRCVAVVQKRKFTLTLTVGEGGKVESVPEPPHLPAQCNGPKTCAEQYDEDEIAKLTAVENVGWQFAGWRGVCVGNSRTCFVTMDNHHAAVATFVRLDRGRITSPAPFMPPLRIGSPVPITYLFAHSGQSFLSQPRLTSADAGNVKIELSRDNGITFETLFTSIPDSGSACWTITGPPTALALIKVSSLSDPSVTALSDRPFTIVASDGVSSTIPASIGSALCEGLSTSDQRSQIRGGSFFADRYSFSGVAGQQVVMTLNSSAFDTYLYVVGPNGSIIADDDNGGAATISSLSSKSSFLTAVANGTDSRIPAASGFFTLPARGVYVIEVTSAIPNSIGPYQLRLDGGPLLLTVEGAERGTALDSVTMMPEPFPLATTLNFSADHRTRIMLFALYADLLPGEDRSVVTAQAEDPQQRITSLPVEVVGIVPGFDWLTQINVKVPDELASQSDMLVSISLRGTTSNKVLIRLFP